MKHRNSGIDLLKIISMTYIVILHCMGHGGVLGSVEETLSYNVAWFIETWCYCAVDIFALISGYLAYQSHSDTKMMVNYVNLWIQVVFYAFLVLLYYSFVVKQCSFLEYLPTSILPVSHGLYWYFTAYSGLFVMMPILKHGLENINTKQSVVILILSVLSFSIIQTVGNDPFKLQDGYSAFWLIVLFVVGYLINKSRVSNRIKPYYAVISILVLCFITWYNKLRGTQIVILGYAIDNNALLSYTSPTILFVSILYLITFEQFSFNVRLARLFQIGADSAFAVYLLNDHRLIRQYFISGRFSTIANNPLILCIEVVLFSIAYFWICVLIDRIRLFLFKALKIKKRVEQLLSFM